MNLSMICFFITVTLWMNYVVIVGSLEITFEPKSVTLHMHDSVTIQYNMTLDNSEDITEWTFYSEDTNVASVQNDTINPEKFFKITGEFLGQTLISCKNIRTDEKIANTLTVIVIREQRAIDTVFTSSVATLMCIIYINFGCAIKWSDLRNILKKPIGPSIGFFGQFVIMPLLSYGLGKLLFPNNPEMQLGLFFTGVCPGGGASNVWTVLLDGNMNLSVIMSAISTITSFGMMPLWIFTLGRTIFESGNLEVPYTQITTYVFALIVPLAIGYLIQRFLPKIGQFMIRILKGFSSLLILFIIIFATVTNLYLFQLFSWQIIVGGMALPWLGFVFGYLIALIFRQSKPDCLTIAIEVGIQNTGIPIFLLRFALSQPQADLTTIAPVSVAILTPFPLLFLFIYKKIRERVVGVSKSKLPEADDQKEIDNYINGAYLENKEKIATIT